MARRRSSEANLTVGASVPMVGPAVRPFLSSPHPWLKAFSGVRRQATCGATEGGAARVSCLTRLELEYDVATLWSSARYSREVRREEK